MRIFNKAVIASAFGMILLVTFGCDAPRDATFYKSYDKCMMTFEIPVSPSMKDKLCKEYALRIMNGWRE